MNSMRHRVLPITCTFVALAVWLAPVAEAAQYTAFSLRVAQERIEAAGDGWREKEPEVLSLGGINRVEGFVYDDEHEDLILVGEHDETRADLTLDDLVVALRARFVHGEWPLVSIDPTPDTEKTEMQHVRFEGGIEDTAFGQSLFEADYRLKEMGMGLVETGVPGLRTGWDRDVQEFEERAGGGEWHISSRFWFYPINPQVMVREGVCVVRGLKVGVFTEVLSAAIDGKPVEDLEHYKSDTNEAWAKDVSERFDDLYRTQPSFNRLRGLQELTAASKALEESERRPDLGWWLTRYAVATVETPKEAKVLRRRHDQEGRGWFEVSGGVHLTALAMRLNAGDVSALRRAVLDTRPQTTDLAWRFVVAEWVIPLAPATVNGVTDVGVRQPALAMRLRAGDPAALQALVIETRPNATTLTWSFAVGSRGVSPAAPIVDMASVSLLFGQAVFLQQQERLGDAVVLYEQVLGVAPESCEAWSNKGAALCHLGRAEEALPCFDHALGIDPEYAQAWHNSGVALRHLGRSDEALTCFDRALEIVPRRVDTWNQRAITLEGLGRAQEALACYDHALAVDPQDAATWYNKGVVLGDVLGRMGDALTCYSRALEINPRHAEAWYNKGVVLGDLGRMGDALTCYSRALEINPRHAEAWYNKGVVLGDLGRTEEALACYDRAVEISPGDAQAWFNRGGTLAALGRTEAALVCLDRALLIDPQDPLHWDNKGLALVELGRLQDALVCFEGATRVDPQCERAWHNRGVLLYQLGRYAEARRAFEKAADLGGDEARRALDVMTREGH